MAPQHRSKGWLAERMAGLTNSRWLSSTAIQYSCASSGGICASMFLLRYVVADFVAPIKHGGMSNKRQITIRNTQSELGSGCTASDIWMFYLPFSAATGPASAGLWTFILPVSSSLPHLTALIDPLRSSRCSATSSGSVPSWRGQPS